MPLTTTQTKILASHLTALRYSLSGNQDELSHPDFGPHDVMGSLILELGPHISPLLSQAITADKNLLEKFNPKQINGIIDKIDTAEDVLQDCIDANIPPGKGFREIIAALLEQLMPILIQIIIGFLLEPETKPPGRINFNNK